MELHHKPGVQKRIVWRVLDQYPNQGFQGEDISFIVKGSPLRKFFTTINTGFAMGAGFQVGLSVGQLGKFGWYLKGITTLSMPHTTEYECDERGVVNNIQPAYSGMANTSKAYGIAGLIIRVSDPFYLNAGVGYGARNQEWETADGMWVKYLPGSYRGLVIDAGMMFLLNHITLSAGAAYILGGSVDVGVGIGYVF